MWEFRIIDFNSGWVPIQVKTTTGRSSLTGWSTLHCSPKFFACFFKKSTHGSTITTDKKKTLQSRREIRVFSMSMSYSFKPFSESYFVGGYWDSIIILLKLIAKNCMHPGNYNLFQRMNGWGIEHEVLFNQQMSSVTSMSCLSNELFVIWYMYGWYWSADAPINEIMEIVMEFFDLSFNVSEFCFKFKYFKYVQQCRWINKPKWVKFEI